MTPEQTKLLLGVLAAGLAISEAIALIPNDKVKNNGILHTIILILKAVLKGKK